MKIMIRGAVIAVVLASCQGDAAGEDKQADPKNLGSSSVSASGEDYLRQVRVERQPELPHRPVGSRPERQAERETTGTSCTTSTAPSSKKYHKDVCHQGVTAPSWNGVREERD